MLRREVCPVSQEQDDKTMKKCSFSVVFLYITLLKVTLINKYIILIIKYNKFKKKPPVTLKNNLHHPHLLRLYQNMPG